MTRIIATTLAVILFSTSTFASEEILYNMTTKKSVLDMKTDPELKPWENPTNLDELCYKGSSAERAHLEILDFEEKELLFDFDTESYTDSYVEGENIIIYALNGKMMDDGLTEEEATIQYIIGKCIF